MNELILTITGARMSGKTWILNKIKPFLELLDFDIEVKHGNDVKTEHQLIIRYKEKQKNRIYTRG